MDDGDALLLVKRAFLGRYLDWCLHECQKEVDTSLGRIASIPSLTIVDALRILKTLAAEKQMVLFEALNASARRQLGLGAPTQLQEAVLADYQREARAWMQTPEHGGLLQLAVSPKVAPGNALRLIRKEIDPLLGRPTRNGSRCLRYSTCVGGCTLFTEVQSDSHSIHYHHTLHFGHYGYWPEEPRKSVLCEMISFAAWLGISGVTQMDLFAPEETQSVVHAIAEFCAYFKAALPELIASS